jgi:hypothetical protein
MFDQNSSRRDLLKKAAYVAPLILTMNVSLASAQVGSGLPPVNPANISLSSSEQSSGGGEHLKNLFRGHGHGHGHAYGLVRRDDD